MLNLRENIELFDNKKFEVLHKKFIKERHQRVQDIEKELENFNKLYPPALIYKNYSDIEGLYYIENYLTLSELNQFGHRPHIATLYRYRDFAHAKRLTPQLRKC